MANLTHFNQLKPIIRQIIIMMYKILATVWSASVVEAVNIGKQPPRPNLTPLDEDFSYENRIDAMLVQESEMATGQDEDTILIELDEPEDYMSPMQELWVSYLQYGEEGPEQSYYMYDESSDQINSRQEYLNQRAALGDQILRQRLAQDPVREQIKADPAQKKLDPIEQAKKDKEAEEKQEKEDSAKAAAAPAAPAAGAAAPPAPPQAAPAPAPAPTASTPAGGAATPAQAGPAAGPQPQDAAPASAQAQANSTRTLHIIPYSHVSDLHLADQQIPDKGARFGPLNKQRYNNIFTGSVRDILNTTVEELLNTNYTSANRTFTFADLKYFKHWYEKLNSTTQDEVKQLVHEGRLDLVAGSWMPVDEALTQADAIIDSFMVGQQFLQKEFEVQPRVSWQLDGNGISSGYARLAKDLGIDMLIYSSVSKNEKKQMREKKGLAQVWRTSERNFGKRKDVLAVALDQVSGGASSYCWPMGFWADANYLIDTPLSLNKSASNYQFDKVVKSLYAEVASALENERTNHIMRPFGCDMAYADATTNYLITDELIKVWNELGFDKDIKIEYSTPTRFYEELKKENEQNSTNIVEKGGWPLRKDDTFPYGAQSRDGVAFFSGYYSSRPLLKQSLRELTSSYHSVSRLLAQQVLRTDLETEDPKETRNTTLAFQSSILELIGDLQSYDAIAGTQKERLAANYIIKARNGLKDLNALNSQLLEQKLKQLYGIETKNLESGPSLVTLEGGMLRSTWSTQKELLLVVQNPSSQRRHEVIELQLPYYNFTLDQVRNFSQRTEVKFEKYLPRLWQNTNNTQVRSLAQFRVEFNANELFQVFVVKDLGTIRQKNAAPRGFPFAASKIWNLNLPVFLPRYRGDVDHFQPNFRQMWPGNEIKVGTKTLKFIEILKAPKIVYQNTTTAKGAYAASSANKTTTVEKENNTVDLTLRDTGNTTSILDPQNPPVNASNQTNSNKLDNSGAAVFLFTDSATGISQKFALNLRYYIGAGESDQKPNNFQQNAAGLSQLERKVASGLYEFKVNTTKTKSGQKTQKSYKYGRINNKRSRIRQNERSGEMLLMWEQVYGAQETAKKSAQPSNRSETTNDTDAERIRASVRIDLNDVDNFVRFHVSTNEVPIENDKTGKDIVVDWHLLDGFDSAGKLWVDANGMQMVQKQLNKRQEYELPEQDKGVGANFFPMTSAIAIKDYNKTASRQKQVLIMSDRSVGASAGLRENANIEIMHQRRYKRSLAPTFKGKKSQQAGALNDLDEHGRGVQVSATYFMQVSDVSNQYIKKIKTSEQRAMQRRLDQPLIFSFAKGFSGPARFNSTNTTAQAIDNSLFAFMHSQMNESEALNRTSFAAKRLNSTAAPAQPKNETNATASFDSQNTTSHNNLTDSSFVVNREAKESKTLKIIPFGVRPNEVLVRVTNLEDKFDGLAYENSSIMFNVNDWAREFYLEANMHNAPEDGDLSKLLEDLRVNVVEMTLSGSIAKSAFSSTGNTTRHSDLYERYKRPNVSESNGTASNKSSLAQVMDGPAANASAPVAGFYDDRNVLVKDGAGVRSNLTALKQKYTTATWLTLNDTKTSDVGSGPFCLAAASSEVQDQIYDSISFNNKIIEDKDGKVLATVGGDRTEQVHVVALEPQAIRVFSVRYESLKEKKDKADAKSNDAATPKSA